MLPFRFQLTPWDITHKPTDACFAPNLGDSSHGIMRLGQLNNFPRAGDAYDPDAVKKMMRGLWVEYVAANSDLFNDQRESLS